MLNLIQHLIAKKQMIEIEKDVYFSSKIEDMNLDVIYNFIKNSYWGKNRTLEEQQIVLKNSINFGLFVDGNQIAYSRVMTDYVFFAYLLDVFVLPEYQGKGYSKILITKILKYPELLKIDKWMLATKDAHGLYKKFGFEAVKNPTMLMEKMSDRAKNIYL